jgi:hypothetical protein
LASRFFDDFSPMIFHGLEKNHGGKIISRGLRGNKTTSIVRALGKRTDRISDDSSRQSCLGKVTVANPVPHSIRPSATFSQREKGQAMDTNKKSPVCFHSRAFVNR